MISVGSPDVDSVDNLTAFVVAKFEGGPRTAVLNPIIFKNLEESGSEMSTAATTGPAGVTRLGSSARGRAMRPHSAWLHTNFYEELIRSLSKGSNARVSRRKAIIRSKVPASSKAKTSLKVVTASLRTSLRAGNRIA